MKIVTIDLSDSFSAEAGGHPSECTEIVSGQVQKDSDHNVTITNASGETKQIATIKSADMFFEKHAHDHETIDGCHNEQKHTLDPDTGSKTVTINSSPVYLLKDGVTTDPGSNGDVNITDSGINNSVSNSEA